MMRDGGTKMLTTALTWTEIRRRDTDIEGIWCDEKGASILFRTAHCCPICHAMHFVWRNETGRSGCAACLGKAAT